MTAAAAAASPGRDAGLQIDLADVSGINETIRRIDDASRQITLVAVNAMLAARRLDRSAPGFQTVTFQLRDFSRQLDTRMQGMRVDISRLVEAVARSVRQCRNQEYLRAASRRSRAAYGTLAGTQLQIAADEIHILLTSLRQGRSLVGIGLGLAGLASIEAQRTGESAAQLSIITRRIHELVDTIETAIKQAISHLNGRKTDTAR